MKTDSAIQRDVMDEIKFDPKLKDIATEIGVSAKEGVITISGIVDTYLNKLAVENAAQRVAGVKVVAVDLEVKTPSSSMKTDIEIATAVKNALTWHSAVNEDQIEIKVDNGWVHLDGFVEWDYMKKAAENAIGDLKGVRGITNKITLKGTGLDSSEIKRKIKDAFHRSATIDASNINVAVSGGRITLSGKARSWAERNDAESAAWSLPGAISVENKIEVDSSILENA